MTSGEARGLRVFLSYRRDETVDAARSLYELLGQRLPESQIFWDIGEIEPGLDFVQVIEHAVGSCDVLIALIGRQWLSLENDAGHRRLDDPLDFVRLEIATALKRDVRVIPVLLHNATMPRESELPEPLRPLSRRHAIDLSTSRWDYDVSRLVEWLKRIPAQPLEPPTGQVSESADAGLAAARLMHRARAELEVQQQVAFEGVNLAPDPTTVAGPQPPAGGVDPPIAAPPPRAVQAKARVERGASHVESAPTRSVQRESAAPPPETLQHGIRLPEPQSPEPLELAVGSIDGHSETVTNSGPRAAVGTPSTTEATGVAPPVRRRSRAAFVPGLEPRILIALAALIAIVAASLVARAVLAPQAFGSPTGLAIDSGDNVYVLEATKDRILKFDTDGKRIWSQAVARHGLFLQERLAINRQDDVLVVGDNSAIAGVQVIGSDGRQRGSICSACPLAYGIAVDGQGNIYLTNDVGHSAAAVSKFTADGMRVADWGTHHDGPGHFGQLEGIAVDSTGNVYVAGPSDGIAKFGPDGTLLTHWPKIAASGLAVDREGYVYAGAGPEVIKLSPDGSPVQTFKGGLGNPEMGPPPRDEDPGGVTSVALDSHGNVYAADGGDTASIEWPQKYYGRVAKFAPDGTLLASWDSSDALKVDK